MKQYEMFELQFQGEEPAGSQAVVDVTAEFSHTGADGKQAVKTVKGFYAGKRRLQGTLLSLRGRRLHLEGKGPGIRRGKRRVRAL